MDPAAESTPRRRHRLIRYSLWVRATHLLFGLSLSVAACGGDLELKIDTPWIDEAAAAIPAGGTLTRDLDVGAEGPVMQGTAEAILQHPAPDDLRVTLRSAAGTEVELGGRIAEGDDEYRYAVPLLGVQGEEGRGTWRLVIDATAAGAPGSLQVWGVQVGP